jgi:hypothetical protein
LQAQDEKAFVVEEWEALRAQIYAELDRVEQLVTPQTMKALTRLLQVCLATVGRFGLSANASTIFAKRADWQQREAALEGGTSYRVGIGKDSGKIR